MIPVTHEFEIGDEFYMFTKGKLLGYYKLRIEYKTSVENYTALIKGGKKRYKQINTKRINKDCFLTKFDMFLALSDKIANAPYKAFRNSTELEQIDRTEIATEPLLRELDAHRRKNPEFWI